MFEWKAGSICRPAMDKIGGALLMMDGRVRLVDHIEVVVEACGILVLAINYAMAEVVHLVHSGDGHSPTSGSW